VLFGKKNLEIHPLAVNKGEIVRRLVYENPDVDFVCVGDDKVSGYKCRRRSSTML
jgi:trehalose 6-phosphate synthase/phosphatase